MDLLRVALTELPHPLVDIPATLRLKSNLKLEYSHSMSPVLYNQEVEMRVLMDTLTLLLQERGKAASKSNGRSKKNTYLFVMDVVLKQFIINLQILAAKCRRQGLG